MVTVLYTSPLLNSYRWRLTSWLWDLNKVSFYGDKYSEELIKLVFFTEDGM